MVKIRRGDLAQIREAVQFQLGISEKIDWWAGKNSGKRSSPSPFFYGAVQHHMI